MTTVLGSSDYPIVISDDENDFFTARLDAVCGDLADCQSVAEAVAETAPKRKRDDTDISFVESKKLQKKLKKRRKVERQAQLAYQDRLKPAASKDVNIPSLHTNATHSLNRPRGSSSIHPSSTPSFTLDTSLTGSQPSLLPLPPRHPLPSKPAIRPSRSSDVSVLGKDSLLKAPMPSSQPSGAPIPVVPRAPMQTTSNAQLQSSIGMPPDKDPNSKHGVYHSPSNPPPSWNRHIPNPARTLVIEQLPKTHRSAEFINSWSRSVCGALPVHVEVDKKGGKALVEFSTAELARLAWGSPRLTSSPTKRKPRLDLIRVWWYRVDGIGAGSGVGEIEEGEIEGDAAETPVSKETKKQRKARLARERMESQQDMQPGHIDNILSVQTTRYLMLGSGSTFYPTIPTDPLDMNATALQFGLMPPLPLAPTFPPYGSVLPESRSTWSSAAGSGLSLEHNIRPYHQSPNDHFQNSDHISIASSRRSSISSIRTSIPKLPFGEDEHGGVQDMDVDEGMDLRTPAIDPSLPPTLPMASQHMQSAVSIDSASSPSDNPLARAANTPTPITAPIPRSANTIHTNLTTLPSLATQLSNMLPVSTLSPIATISASALPTATESAMQVAENPLPGLNSSQDASQECAAERQSLSPRQKELEERLAASKAELEMRQMLRQRPPPISIVTAQASGDSQPSQTEQQQKIEERLRTLVVASQKLKKSNTADTSPAPISSVSAPLSQEERITGATLCLLPAPSRSTTPLSSSSTSRSNSAGSQNAPTNSNPFDDQAISFLNETIATLKRSSTHPMKPTPTLTMKEDLAAKQKKLEQQIAESRMLMAKLEKATSKHERTAILAIMRERSRTTAPDVKSESTPTLPKPVLLSLWCSAYEYDGILEISDDEDDA